MSSRETLIEERAKIIYDSWKDQKGWVTWVEGGNSNRQTDARIASRVQLESEGILLKEGEFFVKLSSLDVPNQNKIIYPTTDSLKKAIKKFNQREPVSVTLGAPTQKQDQSIDDYHNQAREIDETNVCGYLSGLKIDPSSNALTGKIIVGGPQKDVLNSLLGEGEQPSFGIRAFCKLVPDQNSGNVFHDVQEIITFDLIGSKNKEKAMNEKIVLLEFNKMVLNAEDHTTGVYLANTGVELQTAFEEALNKLNQGPCYYYNGESESTLSVRVSNKKLIGVDFDFVGNRIVADQLLDLDGTVSNSDQIKEWFKDKWFILKVKETFINRTGQTYLTIKSVGSLARQEGFFDHVHQYYDKKSGVLGIRVVAGRVNN